MEWTDKLITTDIDKLLEYLIRKKKASTREAARDLDVTDEMIESWVSALVESGLVEKTYSTTKGTVLKPKIDSIEEEKEEVKEQAKKQVSETKKDFEGVPELEEAMGHLRKLEKVLEKELDSIEAVEDLVRDIKEDESELEEEFEDGKLSPKVVDILEDVDESIGSVESVKKKKERFKQRKKKIESFIESLDRLEKVLEERMEDSTVCNICGEDFSSEEDMRTHISEVHGEGSEEKKGLLGKLKGFFT